MKSRHPYLPYVLLVMAWLVFAGYVLLTSTQLPERVATHFDIRGTANGWQSHAHYIRFTLIFGAAVPAFILGVFNLIRLGSGAGMNIPNKEYWLGPERRAETLAFVQRQGTWFAGLLIAFFAAVHYYVLMANAQSPAGLSPTFIWGVAGILVAGAVVMLVTFIRYFYRRPA